MGAYPDGVRRRHLARTGVLVMWLSILSALMPSIGTVLDRVIPDKNAALKAQLEIQTELTKLDGQALLAQLDINKAEAANPNFFTSGGRPAIMWVFAAALALTYVLTPAIGDIQVLFGHAVTPLKSPLDDHLWELITGMLGLAGWRSMDKKNGVASK